MEGGALDATVLYDQELYTIGADVEDINAFHRTLREGEALRRRTGPLPTEA